MLCLNKLLTFLVGLTVGLVQAELDIIYMDSPAFCGKTIVVAEQQSRVVESRSGSTSSNPPTSCSVHFESQHQESSYIFEISVESVRFEDCNIDVRIYDGPQVGGNYIRLLVPRLRLSALEKQRQIGCGTSSLSKFYSKDRYITLLLTRKHTIYRYGNHFRLRVRTFRDPDAPDEYLGTYRFSAGAIIGIVLGIAVIIVLAILLGWCYKTGRLPGYSRTEYPPNYKNQENTDATSISKSEGMRNDPGFVSWNTARDVDKMSTTSVSRSNFDLDNPDMWASLTGPSGNKKSTNHARSRNMGSDPNVSRDYVNVDTRGGKYGKSSSSADNIYENFTRTDPLQLSHSPASRIRRDNTAARKETTFDGRGELGLRGTGRGTRDNARGRNDKSDDKTMKKRTNSGLFENPDSEGYLYDYEQVQALSDDNPQKGKKKTQDFESELKDAIRRNSMKRQQSASGSEAPGAPGSSAAELNRINFSDDSVSIPKYDGDSELSTSNPAIGKEEDTGPDAQSSPKPKKKKRKSSKERKSPKSKRKGAHEGDDAENKSPKSKRKVEEDEPPEVYAPIFSEEEPDDPASVPNMYQPGYQGNYPPAPYYNPQYPGAGYPQGPYPGYPPGIPGMPPAGPYQTAGQAQWYVQGTPDGQQKMAFAMTTHSHGSHDDAMAHPGMPNSSSTPYYQTQYGAPGGPGNALVPAGTILDDPQVPAPGTSLVRYDDDPTTGVKTSQVIWTDSKPDPTDPPPGSNPQITRKTISRVTTKATTDELPDAPNPSLHDMSYRTAQQIQASRGAEPAFMSPSSGAPALQYAPANSIQYASETPERTNASFYAGPRGPSHIPGAPGPVIHEAPERNQAIRDKIVMPAGED